jgi:hypothetical protein
VATEGDATLLRASWAGNTQRSNSQDVVKEIRRSSRHRATSLVGGQSANTVDLITRWVPTCRGWG